MKSIAGEGLIFSPKCDIVRVMPDKSQVIVKSFKYRLAPCRRETELLRKYAGASRIVRNDYIRAMEYHRGEKEVRELTEAYMPGEYKAQKRPTFNEWWQDYKRRRLDIKWMRSLHDHTIRGRALYCDQKEFKAAWKRWEKTHSVKKAGFPHTHSWEERCSFTIPEPIIVGGKLRIPMARGGKTFWGEKAPHVRIRPSRGRGAWAETLRVSTNNAGKKITQLKEIIKMDDGKERVIWWTVKSAVVKREICSAYTDVASCNYQFRLNDKWYISVQCEIAEHEFVPKNHAGRAAGIDMNIKPCAVWDGERSYNFDIPKKTLLEARRRRYQRRMARKERMALKSVGWDNKSETRNAAKIALGKKRQLEKVLPLMKKYIADGMDEQTAKRRAEYETPRISRRYETDKRRATKAFRKIRQFRDNQTHHISSKITRDCGLIFVEDLKIPNMTKSAKGTTDKPGKNVSAKTGLNREILAQRWGDVRQKIAYKAQWRGGRMEEVSAAYTSQTCHACGYIDKANRKTQAKFKCVACGHEDNADVNAAKNILEKGLTGTEGETVAALKAVGFGGSGLRQNCESSKGVYNRPMKSQSSISQGRNERKSPIKQGDMTKSRKASLRSG